MFASLSTIVTNLSLVLKKRVALAILLCLVVIFSIFTIVLIFVLTKENISNTQSISTTNQILLLGGASVPGVTCTILTVEDAKNYINGPIERSSTNRTVATENNEWQHDDSCRYQNPADSAEYVELFITTYQTAQSAEDAFKTRLPIVSDAEVVTLPEQELEQALYDAGVYYVLKDRQIIETAAGSSSLATQNEKSRNVLLKALDNLQPIGL
jgi:DNA-binding phage protein